MKSIKLLAVVAVSLFAMSFVVPAELSTFESGMCESANGGGVVWKSEVIDLGNIPQGKPVSVEFEFTNKSKQAVIITNVATTCGCTVADYEKKPIDVNKVSKIGATYNAAGLGAFTKSITVTFADNESKILTIKGTVVAP